MTGIESGALRLAKVVVTHAAKNWLGDRKTAARRGKDLTELIKWRFPGVLPQRQLPRRLADIEDAVFADLAPHVETEFSRLPENERAAALAEVVHSLEQADLSDSALLGVDADPIALAAEVRRTTPKPDLSPDGAALHDVLLERCCVQLVHLVRELPEYGTRVVEETLARLSSVADSLTDVLQRLPRTSVDAPRGTDHDTDFEERYRRLIALHHDDLELIGVPVRNFRPRTTLSVAYLSLTVAQRVRERKDFALHEWFDDNDAANSGFTRVEGALSTANRALIRGEAGAGKSTLLRWLAMTAAQRGFQNELDGWNGSVPILLKLRNYANQPLPRPQDFLSGPHMPVVDQVPEGWTHRMLQSGRALLLVDGVDELAETERGRVRDWLKSLVLQYPDARMVVTTRPAAAKESWLSAEGFTAVELAPMTPTDIRDFIDRWHDALLTAGGDTLPFEHGLIKEHQQNLPAQLGARTRLRTLVRNPLMCAMLCALNLDRGGNLPRNRRDLYSAALEMLLWQRESTRNIPSRRTNPLNYQQTLAVLGDLAWYFAINGYSEINHDQALWLLDRKLPTLRGVDCRSTEALRHLVERSGVLRTPAVDRVDFIHRTFQEFLAAREAADNGHVGLLIDKADDDQWRETVIMTTGLLHKLDRRRLIDGILDRVDTEESTARSRQLRLVLAASQEALPEVQPLQQARIDSAVSALVPPEANEETQSLATIGDPVLDYLPLSTESLTDEQAEACVETVALVNGPRALQRLADYASGNSQAATHFALMRAWSLFDADSYAQRVMVHLPPDRGITVHRLDHLAALRALSDERRVDLDLLANQPVTSLDFLRDTYPLWRVTLNGSGTLMSLAPLRQQGGVQWLELIGARKWSHLDTLHDLTGLIHLTLHQKAPLEELEFLRDHPRIRTLSLGSLLTMDDYRPLTSLPQLLALTLKEVSDTSVLLPLATSSLHCLAFEDCGHGDIGPALPPTLRELRVVNSCVGNLSPQSPLTALTEVSFDRCSGPIDLTPLRDAPELQRVLLVDNEERIDLTPLAGRSITLYISDDLNFEGVGQLGPEVAIKCLSRREARRLGGKSPKVREQ